jgi:glucokinase
MGSDAVALAMDVGGTGIKCALVDVDGTIRYAQRHPTAAERGPDAVVATILDLAEELANHARTLGLEPVSAGVIVPAVVADGIALWSANLGLRDVPLRELLTRRLGLPSALGHDVRAAALAEAQLGAGRRTRRLLFVALGTGIAGGFVLDGRVDDGAHGAGGEIGHIAVRLGPDARACGCGGRGCLERYASAAAIARTYAERTAPPAADYPLVGDPSLHLAADEVPSPAPGQGQVPAPAVAREAHEVANLVGAGDPVAQAVWDEAVAALADGLLVGIALYDPAVLAIGGGLAEAGDLLLDPLRAALEERRAELGEEAGVRGAALLALGARS